MRLSYARRMPAAALLLVAILGSSTVLAQSDLPTITSSGAVALPTASSETAAASTTASSGTDTRSSSGDATTTNDLPNLTSATATSKGGSTTDDLPVLSTTSNDLPTLPGGYNYPAPTVPPMVNAPYLKTSKYPQDTVFIIVGAIIAFVATVILAWRLLVAWSINRSVRNAATAGYSHMGDSKGGRKKSALGPYGPAPIGSTISLEKLGTGSRHGTSNSKSHIPNASLFFSPTAGAGMHTANSSRASSYLPSGYYSAGNVTLGGGTGTTVIGGGADKTSKMRPASDVMVSARPIDPSPPDSPNIRPSTGGVSIVDSRSSLNLVPTGDRTPSTYLDDLMSTGVPPVPRHGHTSSRHSLGRDRDVRRY